MLPCAANGLDGAKKWRNLDVEKP